MHAYSVFGREKVEVVRYLLKRMKDAPVISKGRISRMVTGIRAEPTCVWWEGYQIRSRKYSCCALVTVHLQRANGGLASQIYDINL